MATPFHLSEQDLNLPTTNGDNNNTSGVGGGGGGGGDGVEEEMSMMMDKIPILKRRAAAATAAISSDSKASTASTHNDPICVIVVGMAGSGKTTLMAQLQRSLNLKSRDGGDNNDGDGDGDADATTATDGGETTNTKSSPSTSNKNDSITTTTTTKTPTPSRAGYAINLDPAAKYVPFSSSIDIRDTVDYLEVMRQHKLGPNGAILTCLNLFATKFDQVMGILERRAFGTGEEEVAAEKVSSGKADGKKREEEDSKAKAGPKTTSTNSDTTTQTDTKTATGPSSSSSSPSLDYILIDTPGQIEAFTWSASGSIVTSALATTFPTVLAFVVDTPRCAQSVHTFMSNMLYACSMLYRAKLPMVVVLNKTDVVGCEFVKEWMEDYESFQEALDDASAAGSGYSDEMAGGGGGYYSSLTRSLSLVLDEFYNHLHKVGVSAATGDGVEEFWEVVQKAAGEYEEGYLVDLKLRMEEQRAKERAKKRVGARRLVRDLEEDTST